MRRAKRGIRKVVAVCSAILGALSILKLIQYGFNYGFGPSLGLVLSFHEAFTRSLFGWAEPYIREQLTALRALVGWNLHLYPHWKHVFLLTGIYFFRDAVNQTRLFWKLDPVEHVYRPGRYFVSPAFYAVSGAIVSTVAAIGAGVVPATRGDYSANFQIAVFPIMGIFAYDFFVSLWDATFRRGDKEVYSWSGDFIGRMVLPIFRTSFGTGALIVGLQNSFVRSLPSPGLFMLAVFVLIVAFSFLVVALKYYIRNWEWRDTYKGTDGSRGLTIWDFDYWRLGTGIITIFLGVGFFIALNAGLGLLGM